MCCFTRLRRLFFKQRRARMHSTLHHLNKGHRLVLFKEYTLLTSPSAFTSAMKKSIKKDCFVKAQKQARWPRRSQERRAQSTSSKTSALRGRRPERERKENKYKKKKTRTGIGLGKGETEDNGSQIEDMNVIRTVRAAGVRCSKNEGDEAPLREEEAQIPLH